MVSTLDDSKRWNPHPIAGAKRKLVLTAFSRARTVFVPAAFLVLLVIAAVFPEQLAPYNLAAHDLANNVEPPVFMPGGSLDHLLGTDQLGRDVLTRIIYGARISLAVGAASVLIAGTVGVILGLVAGYWGAWIDELITRLADVQLAFPYLLLAIAVVAVVGPGIVTIIMVLGLTRWTVYVRTVRGDVLSVREKEYLTAARCVGASDLRIVFHHVLPNVIQPTIVVATFTFANNIVAEASLSFLGLGIPPPTPTWGGMLAEGRQYLTSAWWIAAFPGLALALTVLSANLLGDWLRDELDPRVKRGRI
ncbi:MAG: ABC transporter permease [Chloroflexi bacterium]|nr:ABC transporter permease [Chloroflexota bacterium]